MVRLKTSSKVLPIVPPAPHNDGIAALRLDILGVEGFYLGGEDNAG